jgi:uncharacterized protein HemY
VAGFISGWIQTRRIRNLLFGIPALACAMLVVALTIRSREEMGSETIRRYIDTAQMHLKKNELDEADFYLNRLKNLAYKNDTFLLTRAEIAIGRERTDLAEVSFREMLQNSDHTRDAIAHQQLALIEMKSTPDPNSIAASRAINHLLKAVEINDNDLYGHELLANLYLAREDLPSVALHMEPVARQNPAAQINLARVYEKMGFAAKKAESAARAEAYFVVEAARLDAEPTNGAQGATIKLGKQLTLALDWSEALIMQNKLDDAAKVVTNALERQNTVELRRRLASVYVRKINGLRQTDDMWRKKWELICLSRNYDPDAREGLVVLANIASHAPFELRNLAQKQLQPYLDKGLAPPAAYFLMGTAASQAEQWETALVLLRRAVQLEPRADITWNNLAYTLCAMPNPDWEEAERCVDRALRIDPTPAAYHETRGQIMVHQNRWAEAVQELERALSEIPSQARIHEGLATAYLQLGDEDLAEYHRTRQIALSKQSTSGN